MSSVLVLALTGREEGDGPVVTVMECLLAVCSNRDRHTSTQLYMYLAGIEPCIEACSATGPISEGVNTVSVAIDHVFENKLDTCTSLIILYHIE